MRVAEKWRLGACFLFLLVALVLLVDSLKRGSERDAIYRLKVTECEMSGGVWLTARGMNPDALCVSPHFRKGN